MMLPLRDLWRSSLCARDGLPLSLGLPGEELLEQAPQDHGVGDIGHLKLVEAEQRRLVCNLGRGARDRVGGGFAAALDRLMRFRP